MKLEPAKMGGAENQPWIIHLLNISARNSTFLISIFFFFFFTGCGIGKILELEEQIADMKVTKVAKESVGRRP